MDKTNETNETKNVTTDDEKLDRTARFILEKYKEAFEELAK